jgi:hypothetical protein
MPPCQASLGFAIFNPVVGARIDALCNSYYHPVIEVTETDVSGWPLQCSDLRLLSSQLHPFSFLIR